MPKPLSLLRYPGGKYYLIKTITDLIADHDVWLEPMCGGATVSLNKKPSQTEIINDLNIDVFNFWQCIRDHSYLDDYLKNIQYNEEFFVWAADWKCLDTPTHQDTAATKFLVRNRMSRDGMMKTFVNSTRQRRGMNEGISSWLTCIETVPKVRERIKNFQILNQNVLELIPGYLDNPRCVIYLDPPYYLDTRVSKKLYGEYEVDNAFHVMLLEWILPAKAQVILSGYDNSLYNNRLANWHRVTRSVKINMGNGDKTNKKGLRQEVLWVNRLP